MYRAMLSLNKILFCPQNCYLSIIILKSTQCLINHLSCSSLFSFSDGQPTCTLSVTVPCRPSSASSIERQAPTPPSISSPMQSQASIPESVCEENRQFLGSLDYMQVYWRRIGKIALVQLNFCIGTEIAWIDGTKSISRSLHDWENQWRDALGMWWWGAAERIKGMV